MSVDGVDFPIHKPSPFDLDWYSHKFKGPSLWYEVAVSIAGGNICWINGPFDAGKHSDLKIFCRGLMKKLDKDEFVEADHGYKGQPDKVRLPFEAQNKTEICLKERACARHKSMNKLLKQFKALGTRWRHDIKEGRHKAVFDVVATITQIPVDIGVIKPFKCTPCYKQKEYK